METHAKFCSRVTIFLVAARVIELRFTMLRISVDAHVQPFLSFYIVPLKYLSPEDIYYEIG